MPASPATSLPSSVGKLSEQTIAKTVRFVLKEFKDMLGTVPTPQKKEELVTKLRAMDMANVLQDPFNWYTKSTAERAYSYGNQIDLYAAGDPKPFSSIGFDSTGIMKRDLYDMEQMARDLFPGTIETKDCGLGLRIEIQTHNQAGNITTFAHVLNRLYAYDQPLKDEIRRRGEDVAKRCSDPATAEAARKELAAKLDAIYPFEKDHATRIILQTPKRQMPSVEATHFKFHYHYKMMIHSGRITDAFAEFRVNVRNQGFSIVSDDLVAYDRARKTEGGRRTAFAKNKNGMKLSKLAAAVIETLTKDQKEMLFGAGQLNFLRDDISYEMHVKKLEVETLVKFKTEVVNVGDKSATVMQNIPESIAQSLIGQSLRKIIEHPYITDDMIITKVTHFNGATTFTYKAPKVLYQE